MQLWDGQNLQNFEEQKWQMEDPYDAQVVSGPGPTDLMCSISEVHDVPQLFSTCGIYDSHWSPGRISSIKTVAIWFICCLFGFWTCEARTDPCPLPTACTTLEMQRPALPLHWKTVGKLTKSAVRTTEEPLLSKGRRVQTTKFFMESVNVGSLPAVCRG